MTIPKVSKSNLSLFETISTSLFRHIAYYLPFAKDARSARPDASVSPPAIVNRHKTQVCFSRFKDKKEEHPEMLLFH